MGVCFVMDAIPYNTVVSIADDRKSDLKGKSALECFNKQHQHFSAFFSVRQIRMSAITTVLLLRRRVDS